ncbi:MAG: DNA-directed RNA polymerase subunit omega [Deltaproteobacteria bacterium]|nr:DNA-directed RNA polymerase subunit omega [Deltaproteobacteria bacterium]
MARVTIEDCLTQVNNRFSLVQLTLQRVQQIKRGSPIMAAGKNKDIVMALREIAAGKVTLENIDSLDMGGGEWLHNRNEGED